MGLSVSNTSVIRASFKGSAGYELSARLDLPAGSVRAFALFAHCFTCTKDVLAAKRIAAGLAAAGVGVLRFDFTGLGSSEGEFANTNFSSNIEDLVSAAGYLRENFAAPAILVGHSLGGAAVLAAAHDIPEARAVVTIGAPADVGHVLKQFGSSLEEIREKGEAQVTLAGRRFSIRHGFIVDAEEQRLADRIRSLGKALLVMHAPLDTVVNIENASNVNGRRRLTRFCTESASNSDQAEITVFRVGSGICGVNSWSRLDAAPWSTFNAGSQLGAGRTSIETNGAGTVGHE